MARIADRVKELAAPIVAELGLELFDVVFVKEGGEQILRLTLDSEAGISHTDCEAVSRRVDVLLDEVDYLPMAYHLEVSSPGAERPLRWGPDFTRFTGRKVLVKTFAPQDGTREFTGTLVGGGEDAFTIDVEGAPRTFGRDQVALVRLTLD